MKLSLRWLKEYVNITLTPKALAERLTLAGTEVASVEAVGGSWDNISVGQVVALERHPQADRLELATVDIGGERLTVVSGAPNLQVGQKVPFAKVGAKLIDGHTGKPITLKSATIRGVASQGMACSERELGISDSHETVMILDSQAPLGVPLREYLGDAVLDLEVTPNRPDCLSLLGMAWEVAALTGTGVKLPALDYEAAGSPIRSLASVEIADPGLCPRYCASVLLGVKVGPSPGWMQDRLKAAGMRPINNVVDVTNYVLLEWGQPLHAFDLSRLRGAKIIVRRAREGESLITLDGVSRPLSPDMLVIADAQRPVALAGVMGGQETEVTEKTTQVLLESANFHNISIRRTSAALKLRTEASLRFEKGLSPELPLPALRRATQLLVEMGAVAARDVLDLYPGRAEGKPIVFTPGQIKRILGLELGAEELSRVLRSLGFTCHVQGEALQALPPYWRQDIRAVEDVAEEVARILGYEAIPTTLPSGQLPRYEPEPLLELKERVKDILAAAGLQEVITYSLVSREQMEKVASSGPAPCRVANPMTPEQEYLRTTLRPSLLSTLSANARQVEDGLRLFEVGRVYWPREKDLPQEREVVAGVISGPRADVSAWLGGGEEADFYDAKGVVEALLSRVGVKAEFLPAEDLDLAPGRRASIAAEGRGLGVVGQVDPAVASRFDIASSAFLFEIDLEALASAVRGGGLFLGLPRFPGVAQDLAVVVDEGVPQAKVAHLIASASLVEKATLFDAYAGPPLPPGRKSLAYHILYRAQDRTLSGEEARRAQERLMRRLERELGASFRAPGESAPT